MICSSNENSWFIWDASNGQLRDLYCWSIVSFIYAHLSETIRYMHGFPCRVEDFWGLGSLMGKDNLVVLFPTGCMICKIGRTNLELNILISLRPIFRLGKTHNISPWSSWHCLQKGQRGADQGESLSAMPLPASRKWLPLMILTLPPKWLKKKGSHGVTFHYAFTCKRIKGAYFATPCPNLMVWFFDNYREIAKVQVRP